MPNYELRYVGGGGGGVGVASLQLQSLQSSAEGGGGGGGGGIGPPALAGWAHGNSAILVYPFRRLLWQRGQRFSAAAWPLEIQCLQVRHVNQLASAMSAPEAMQTC